MTGLLSLSLTAIAVLIMGYLTYDDLRHDRIPLTVYSTSIVFVALALLVVASAGTGWGLYRLRNWARWGLTILATLPPVSLIVCWILIYQVSDRPWDHAPPQWRLAWLIGLTLITCLPQLIVMWAPKSCVVFSKGYQFTIVQTPELRTRWWAVLPALLLAPAALLSCVWLVATVFFMSVMLGIVRIQ
jgi:hypothetical protein